MRGVYRFGSCWYTHPSLWESHRLVLYGMLRVPLPLGPVWYVAGTAWSTDRTGSSLCFSRHGALASSACAVLALLERVSVYTWGRMRSCGQALLVGGSLLGAGLRSRDRFRRTETLPYRVNGSEAGEDMPTWPISRPCTTGAFTGP